MDCTNFHFYSFHRCLCWSPKGKQFVTGNSDGTLTQFKPDLTAAKSVPAPKLFEGAPVEALAIYWISTFQFAVVYKNATDNSRPGRYYCCCNLFRSFSLFQCQP